MEGIPNETPIEDVKHQNAINQQPDSLVFDASYFNDSNISHAEKIEQATIAGIAAADFGYEMNLDKRNAADLALQENAAEENAVIAEQIKNETAEDEAALIEKYGPKENWPKHAQDTAAQHKLGWAMLGVSVLGVSGGMLGSTDVHAGGLDFLKGSGVEQIGKIFEKGKNTIWYQNKINELQTQQSTHQNKIKSIKGEMELLQKQLENQTKVQAIKQGGELSAQEKLAAAQAKADILDYEGQIKILRADFKEKHPNPSEAELARHDLELVKLGNKIDLIKVSMEGGQINTGSQREALASSITAQNIDLERRINTYKGDIKYYENEIKRIDGEIAQNRLQMGQEIVK